MTLSSDVWLSARAQWDIVTVKPKWRDQARPEQLPPPDWSTIYFRGGRGCVAPWTRIYDPTTGRHARVDDLAAAGQPITVLALTDDGPHATTAEAPFLKGHADLWEFVCSDGSTVTVTGRHRFLTPDGWRHAELLGLGDRLASGAAHPPTSEGRGLSTSPADAPRCSGTAAGSPGRCSTCHRRCGRPLPRVSDSARASAPSTADAPARSPLESPADGPAPSPASSPTCPECGHQTRTRCAPSGPSPVAGESPAGSAIAAPSPRSSSARDRSPRSWTPQQQALAAAARRWGAEFVRTALAEPRTSEHVPATPPRASVAASQPSAVPVRSPALSTSPAPPSDSGRLQPRHPTLAFARSDFTLWTRIVAKRHLGYGAFYDLHVPGPNNYLAEGLWHHNSGKTRSSAEAFAELIEANPADDENGNEWAVVAPTFADARDVCIEGPSGLISALGGKSSGGRLFEKGPLISSWNRSMGQLYLNDGTVIYADGADDGALRVQGKNLRGCWADEIGLWKRWRTAWDESIKYAVRKFPAKRIVSGTPKRNMPAIELVRRLLKDVRVINRKLRTEDNAANLDPVALAELMEAKGTALGGQELEGDVLDEAEGALWTRDPAKADAEKLGLIVTERGVLSDDTSTLTFPDRTVTLARRVVALDPAEGEGDEQGRTVAAIGADRRYYVLHAAGEHLSPMGWLRGSETVFDRYKADRLIYEKNGAMFLKPLLEQEFPRLPVEMVHASQGKRTRAEPIAALYARRMVTHVILPGEDLGPLEAQMTSFTGDPGEDSPGMIDSLVYAISHLHSRARPARSTSVADMRIAG